MQNAPEPLLTREPDIFQRLVETRDRPLVHFLVWTVPAVKPHDGRLGAVLLRVRPWSAECFRPIRCKPLGMPLVIPMAERVRDDLVLQHSLMPRVRQSQQAVTSNGFVDGHLLVPSNPAERTLYKS